MKTVKINKDKLKTILVENKKKHEEAYKEAVEGYNETVESSLRTLLTQAETATVTRSDIMRVVNRLAEPTDHSKEYETAIEMVDLNEEDQIVLDQEDFRQYIQDDWHWKREFAGAYTSNTGKFLD